MDTISSIIKFADNASSLGVIALLAVIIFQLVKGNNVMDMFKTKGHKANQQIIERLDKIAGNHLHDLPGMREDMTKMMAKLDKLDDGQNLQGRQLVRIETTLKLPPM